MQTIEGYYNQKSRTYDDQFDSLYYKVYDAITWKFAEPYVPKTPQGLILDAGGGTGRWSIRIAKKGCKVVLLDASEGMLEKAQTRISREGLQERIVTKKGNILNLDFPDETFDMVFCEHTLFLFSDPSRVVGELTRVLKTNSPMVISAQNKYPMVLAYLPDDVEKAKGLISGHYYHMLGDMKVYTMTPDEIKELLETNRLRIEKMVGKGVTMPLGISSDIYSKKDYSERIFSLILQIELTHCERNDALGLAGHLQAIARKV